MNKLKLFKEELGKLPSEVTQSEWDDVYTLLPKNSETPMPWDADVVIDGNNLIITGGVAPSGGPGECVITIPKSLADKLYDVVIL